MEAKKSFELRGMSLENKGTSPIIRSPWNKVLEGHHSNTRQGSKSHKSKRGHVMKRRKVVMKSRTRRVRVPRREEGDRGIETRVRTLESLIPKNESRDLEGLFRVTAEYIVGLQMRVRVMQMMVDALTNCN